MRHRRTVVGALAALACLRCGIALQGTGATEAPAADASADAPGLDAPGGPDETGGEAGPSPVSDATSDGSGCGGDLSSDPQACGACGHDCLGGTCVAGKCQPFALATGQKRPMGLTLDDSFVYWTNYGDDGMENGEVKRRKKDLTVAVETLAGGQDSPRRLAVTASFVYWTNFGTAGKSGIMGCALVNCAPLQITGANGAWGIALDPTYAYYSAQKSGDIDEVGLVSGQSVVLATGSGTKQTFDVRFAGGFVFFATQSPPEVHRILPNGGGDKKASGPTLKGPEYVAAGTSSLYWSNNGTSGNGFSDGSVSVSDLDPSQNEKPLLPQVPYPRGLALDGTTLYVASYQSGSGGKILSCPTTGTCTPVTAADAQDGPVEVAADATAIYWTNAVGGQVMRLAK